MSEESIIIRMGAIHILDGTMGMPVLSDDVLELTPDVADFIRGHLEKLLQGDERKKCQFRQEESEVLTLLKDFREENFLETSRELAGRLYHIMNENIDIPSGDLLVVSYQSDGEKYLGLLKLNYKETITHRTGVCEAGNANNIIKYQSTLPGTGSKLSEAVLINLEDNSVEVVEKKYEVNGAKCNYLSELYLQCHTQMSPKTKMAVVTRAVEQINRTYYEDDLDKQMETKSVIKEELATDGSLDVERICERMYGEEPDVKEAFQEKMEKYHMRGEVVEPKSTQTVKKFEKQCLKTDTGIEIHIPMEEYNNKDRLEFVTNEDGTVSLIIRGIGHISTK